MLIGPILMELLDFKDLDVLQYISISSDPIITNFSLLESSQRDDSNGGNFMSIGSILTEIS